MENVRTKRWVSAMYAVRKKWFVNEEGEEEEECLKESGGVREGRHTGR